MALIATLIFASSSKAGQCFACNEKLGRHNSEDQYYLGAMNEGYATKRPRKFYKLVHLISNNGALKLQL